MSVAVTSTIRTNPFDSELARTNSSYAGQRDGKLVYLLETKRSLAPLAESVHDGFRAHILNPDFPCVGGKAAINNDTYRFGLYTKMSTHGTTAGLAYDLWEYARERTVFETEYATFVASFAAPVARGEREWEEMLWTQLQSLHDLDRPHHQWDSTVSSDPEDTGFPSASRRRPSLSSDCTHEVRALRGGSVGRRLSLTLIRNSSSCASKISSSECGKRFARVTSNCKARLILTRLA